MPQRSTRYPRWIVGALSGALLFGGAACDDNDFNAVVIVPSAIEIVSGNGQVGTVGQPLASPLVVHVTDRNGNSLPNSIVTWVPCSTCGSVSTSASLTDGNGNASVTWTLGTTVATDSLRAGIIGGGFVTFTATAQAAGPITATIVKTSGDAQTITAGTTGAPMVVTVLDLAGNPVAGATVTWSASGGTLSATTTTTNAAGQTQTTLATGAAAAINTVTVSSVGAAAVTFTITTN